MKNGIILAAFMAALSASAETVKTATQPWVRAYVATNHTDVAGKADVTNVYTKAETDAKITELSPPADLTPATNYTDAALGAFAATGAVRRADNADFAANAENAMSATWAGRLSSGGGVGADNLTFEDVLAGFAAGTNYTDAIKSNIEGNLVNGNTKPLSSTYSDHAQSAQFLQGEDNQYHPADFIRESTNAAVAVVREQSLGGIWDRDLEVWWTPIMENGALRYIATTNVNLNAGN